MQNDVLEEDPEEEQDLNGGSDQNHIEMEDDNNDNEDMEEDDVADPGEYDVEQNDVNENAEEEGESFEQQELD